MKAPRHEPIASLTTEDGRRFQVVQQRQPARSYGKQFMILFTDAMDRAASKTSSIVTLKLLLVLPKFLNFTDFLQVRTVEIAERVGTNNGNISRSMNELQQLGILEREGKGPRTAWRLSSDWGWNGTADQWHAFQAGRMKGKKPPAPPATPEVSGRRMHNAAPAPAVSPQGNKQQPRPAQTRLTLLGVVAGQGAK